MPIPKSLLSFVASTFLLLACNGTDGADGATGPAGADGAAGPAGAEGSSCTARTLVEGVEVSCGGTIIDTLLHGAPGSAGANGLDGVNGANGANGEEGADGANGAAGVSLQWLGALAQKPAAPQLNQAFYWTAAGVSCIWSGSAWQLLSVDNGVQATQCASAPGQLITGSVQDSRDGQLYDWVLIGNQRWMAENLNWAAPSGSYCSEDNAANCLTYGRLYTWDAAMNGASSSEAAPSGVQGVCPVGWHLPSKAEWILLTDLVGDPVGTQLKGNNALWSPSNNSTPAGTNDYGFTAIPSGVRFSNGSYVKGYSAYYWSATETPVTTTYAHMQNLANYDATYSVWNTQAKDNSFAVRCVKN